MNFIPCYTANMSVFKKDILPTPEEMAFYDKNGWLLTNLFITDEVIAELKQAAEELYNCRYDVQYSWSADKGNAGFNEPYLDRNVQRMDAYVSMHKHKIREVIQARSLAAYAAALMKTPLVRLYRDILLTMPPKPDASTGTGLHIDKNYWQTCSSDKLLSAWFSLEDCDPENGCLVVVSGSHKWKRTSFVKKFELNEVDKLRKLYPDHEIEVVSVPHKKGQISFHSCLLMHGSHANTSNVVRQSFAAVYQDRDNHYLKGKLDERRQLINFNTNDRVGPKTAEGYPDYHHPEFYPVLYEAEVMEHELI